MMRYALVKDGIVENVVIWDGEGDIFKDFEVVQLEDTNPVSIGWEYENGEFTNPNEPQPPSKKELYDMELSTIEYGYAQQSDELSRTFVHIMMNTNSEEEKSTVSQTYRDLLSSKEAEIAALKKKYGVK